MYAPLAEVVIVAEKEGSLPLTAAVEAVDNYDVDVHIDGDAGVSPIMASSCVCASDLGVPTAWGVQSS